MMSTSDTAGTGLAYSFKGSGRKCRKLGLAGQVVQFGGVLLEVEQFNDRARLRKVDALERGRQRAGFVRAVHRRVDLLRSAMCARRAPKMCWRSW